MTAASLSPSLRSGPRRGAGAALVALNLYLLSPLLLNELFARLATGGADKLLLFTAPASVLWLAALHTWVRRPLVLHLLLFPFHLAATWDLFVVFNYGSRLSSSTISVILDNQENIADYVANHTLAIFVPLGLSLAGYGLLVSRLAGWSIGWTRRARAVTTAGLLGIYALVAARQVRALGDLKTGLLDVVSHDSSSPLGVVSQTAIALMIYLDNLEYEEASKGFRFDAFRDGPPSPRVVVVVLGESSRRDHWGIYGYARDTTPRLSARGDLLPYRDVTAEAALTKISLPLILTRADADTMAQHRAERSIISAYREAGYQTAWLSTQQRDQWTGAVNRYTNEAEHQRFFERRHDGVLVDELRRWLQTQVQGRPALAVLHTQGSHFTFSDRYPKSFARFTTPRASEQQAMIDAYDNSVAYTDFVLAQVISQLEALPVPTALLYVADHGENLRDDERNLFGHFFGNDKDIPIPMVLWLSRRFVAAEPARAQAAKEHLSRRLSTGQVFHTLLDVGRVKIPGDTQVDSRSLLRETLADRPRLIFTNTNELVDFDLRYPGGLAPAAAAAP